MKSCNKPAATHTNESTFTVNLSNNMNYGMRGESKEVDSIQVRGEEAKRLLLAGLRPLLTLNFFFKAQSFGIRGATSAAIDKTTDEQLGRNIRRDLQYGRR